MIYKKDPSIKKKVIVVKKDRKNKTIPPVVVVNSPCDKKETQVVKKGRRSKRNPTMVDSPPMEQLPQIVFDQNNSPPLLENEQNASFVEKREKNKLYNPDDLDAWEDALYESIHRWKLEDPQQILLEEKRIKKKVYRELREKKQISQRPWLLMLKESCDPEAVKIKKDFIDILRKKIPEPPQLTELTNKFRRKAQLKPEEQKEFDKLLEEYRILLTKKISKSQKLKVLHVKFVKDLEKRAQEILEQIIHEQSLENIELETREDRFMKELGRWKRQYIELRDSDKIFTVWERQKEIDEEFLKILTQWKLDDPEQVPLEAQFMREMEQRKIERAEQAARVERFLAQRKLENPKTAALVEELMKELKRREDAK